MRLRKSSATLLSYHFYVTSSCKAVPGLPQERLGVYRPLASLRPHFGLLAVSSAQVGLRKAFVFVLCFELILLHEASNTALEGVVFPLFVFYCSPRRLVLLYCFPRPLVLLSEAFVFFVVVIAPLDV